MAKRPKGQTRSGRQESGDGKSARTDDSGRSSWTIVIGVATTALATATSTWLIAVPGAVRDSLQGQPPLESPISASVESRRCDSAYVLPSRNAEADAPPPIDDWERPRGATDARHTSLLVTVRSRRQEPIVLTGVRFIVSSRRPPLAGPVSEMDCKSAAAITGRYIAADLDSEPPSIVRSSAGPAAHVGADGLRVEEAKFPYRVTDTDIETLIVVGHTHMCDVRWTAELLWSNGKTSGSYRLTMDGEPFHTAAVVGDVRPPGQTAIAGSGARKNVSCAVGR